MSKDQKYFDAILAAGKQDYKGFEKSLRSEVEAKLIDSIAKISKDIQDNAFKK